MKRLSPCRNAWVEIKLLFKDHLDLRPVSRLADGRVSKEKENGAQKKKERKKKPNIYNSLYVFFPEEKVFIVIYTAVFGLHSERV